MRSPRQRHGLSIVFGGGIVFEGWLLRSGVSAPWRQRGDHFKEHWREVAAQREKGTCIYPSIYPDANAAAPASDDDSLMAQIEPGYLVTSATVDEDGGCVQDEPAKAA